MQREKYNIEKRRGFKKPVVLMDVDDTLINSSRAVIDLLSQKYRFTDRVRRIKEKGGNVYNELKSWTYFGLFCGAGDNLIASIEEDTKKIYESKEFWNSVEFNKGIDKMFTEVGKKFKWIINSKGSRKNLEMKREWLIKHLPENLDYELVLEYINWGDKIKKDHLKGDIIIDDRIDVVKSNEAPVKVLITNYRVTDYNGGIGSSINDFINEDIYKVNEIEEFIGILKFYNIYKKL